MKKSYKENDDGKDLLNYLIGRYGVLLDTKALSEIFNLKLGSLRNSINEARFPVPTFCEGGKRTADVRDVVNHLNARRQSAINDLEH